MSTPYELDEKSLKTFLHVVWVVKDKPRENCSEKELWLKDIVQNVQSTLQEDATGANGANGATAKLPSTEDAAECVRLHTERVRLHTERVRLQAYATKLAVEQQRMRKATSKADTKGKANAKAQEDAKETDRSVDAKTVAQKLVNLESGLHLMLGMISNLKAQGFEPQPTEIMKSSTST